MAHSRGFEVKRFKREGRSMDDAEQFLKDQGYEVNTIEYDPEADEYVAQVRNLDGV